MADSFNVQVAYLVIRVDGTLRIGKKPRIGPDEIAVKLNLRFPPNWGKVIADLAIEVPDFTPEIAYELRTPTAHDD